MTFECVFCMGVFVCMGVCFSVCVYVCLCIVCVFVCMQLRNSISDCRLEIGNQRCIDGIELV